MQHYTIEEKNLERQYLLAEKLKPFTGKAVERIILPHNATVLDVACGIGETTRLLANNFDDAIITGLDRDDNLVLAAKNISAVKHANINFITGDAAMLPFEDNSFDFVFSRYLLMHVPDPVAILQEMKRVCKPGGIVFAQEPDINSGSSFPESWAFNKLQQYFMALFVDGQVGRKLPAYFLQIKLSNLQYQADAVFEMHKNNRLRRLYTLTGEAIGPAILEGKVATEQEYEDWIKELTRAEHDEKLVYLSHPVIAVWGQK